AKASRRIAKTRSRVLLFAAKDLLSGANGRRSRGGSPSTSPAAGVAALAKFVAKSRQANRQSDQSAYTSTCGVVPLPAIDAPRWIELVGSAHPSGPSLGWRCVMLSKSDFWANARECRRLAEEAKSEADREDLMEMAKVWTLLTLQKDLVSPTIRVGPEIK